MPFEWIVATGAGMVTAFNPCGIALLPSYLVYLLSGRIKSRKLTWFDGLRSGLFTTAGFVLLFGVAGLLVGAVGSLLFAIVPYVSLLLAGFMLVMAFYVWRGQLILGLRFQGLANGLENVFQRGSSGSFFVYGVGYGLASLNCSLPVFFTVASQGLTQGPVGGLITFLFYGLGMGLVVITLSVIATVARYAVERVIRSVIPYMQKISALVMAAASLYLIGYWVWGPTPIFH
ncbi:cytochrome c biogenesis CcdA family protein [Alicyclobacillus sp. SP_1]|uniref:cytochrome c biogenesis CcdA family protein n=1 Tax=Alicyclobacillus sp. SP_1 TaxID=2942475 RepID=UPI002156F74D|nr:cytochrome c biogenesis protein CcdA [Alicyclobacillus sp. SP_1]